MKTEGHGQRVSLKNKWSPLLQKEGKEIQRLRWRCNKSWVTSLYRKQHIQQSRSTISKSGLCLVNPGNLMTEVQIWWLSLKIWPASFLWNFWACRSNLPLLTRTGTLHLLGEKEKVETCVRWNYHTIALISPCIRAFSNE